MSAAFFPSMQNDVRLGAFHISAFMDVFCSNGLRTIAERARERLGGDCAAIIAQTTDETLTIAASGLGDPARHNGYWFRAGNKRDLDNILVCHNTHVDGDFTRHPLVVMPPFLGSFAQIQLDDLPDALVRIVLWVGHEESCNQSGRPDDREVERVLTEEAATIHAEVVPLLRFLTLFEPDRPQGTFPLLIKTVSCSSQSVALVGEDGQIIAASGRFLSRHSLPVASFAPNVLGQAAPACAYTLKHIFTERYPGDQYGYAIRVVQISRSEDNRSQANEGFHEFPLAGTPGALFLLQSDDRADRRTQAGQLISQQDSPFPELGGAIAEFLDGTLVRKTQMRRRNRVCYFSLRSWRGAIKDYQIRALKALKKNPPEALVDIIVNDMAQTIGDIFGDSTFGYIVPVPCGHSRNDRCLSKAIARELSKRLGIEFLDAFAYTPLPGTSHPRTNATRPRMKLVKMPDKPVLLVDDVATSGAHIAEASDLVRKASGMAVALAWIGGCVNAEKKK